ncbi:hypothetical protein J6590_023073 [Homalodisca vitripennis]|nr:hypothetical protein J6590_023073 [Homalodisca vitripennis]
MYGLPPAEESIYLSRIVPQINPRHRRRDVPTVRPQLLHKVTRLTRPQSSRHSPSTLQLITTRRRGNSIRFPANYGGRGVPSDPLPDLSQGDKVQIPRVRSTRHSIPFWKTAAAPMDASIERNYVTYFES